jgi:hypothetical protein
MTLSNGRDGGKVREEVDELTGMLIQSEKSSHGSARTHRQNLLLHSREAPESTGCGYRSLLDESLNRLSRRAQKKASSILPCSATSMRTLVQSRCFRRDHPRISQSDRERRLCCEQAQSRG